MRGLSMKSDRVSFDAESSKNGAERKIEIEQYRTLLDMPGVQLGKPKACFRRVNGLELRRIR